MSLSSEYPAHRNQTRIGLLWKQYLSCLFRIHSQHSQTHFRDSQTASAWSLGQTDYWMPTGSCKGHQWKIDLSWRYIPRIHLSRWARTAQVAELIALGTKYLTQPTSTLSSTVLSTWFRLLSSFWGGLFLLAGNPRQRLQRQNISSLQLLYIWCIFDRNGWPLCHDSHRPNYSLQP